MSTDIEVMQVGCISIAHLTEQDVWQCSNLVHDARCALAIAEDKYSVWLHVETRNADEARRLRLNSVADVIEWACQHERNMSWIRLDRDAELVEGLAAYDW